MNALRHFIWKLRRRLAGAGVVERVELAGVDPEFVAIDYTPMSEWGEDRTAITAIAFERRDDYRRKLDLGFASTMRNEIDVFCPTCGNRDTVHVSWKLPAPCSAECGGVIIAEPGGNRQRRICDERH